MAKSYPRYLRDVILARVAAGETVKAVCAEPEMPSAASVEFWRRRDPAFRTSLAQAISQGRWRRFRQFDAAKAEALLDRMRNGATLRAALADPATMSQKAFRYWRATDLEFAAEVARLIRVERDEWITGVKRRRREFDRTLADQILLRVGRGTPLRRVLSADKALPCPAVMARWRRERPEFDDELRAAMKAARFVVRARRLWSEDLQAEIVERIARGASFRRLARQRDMPCEKTFHNWMQRKPGFADAVRWACRERELAHSERMVQIAERATPANAGRARRRISRLRRQNGWRSRWPGEEPGWTEE
jgi:hypothetical protein